MPRPVPTKQPERGAVASAHPRARSVPIDRLLRPGRAALVLLVVAAGIAALLTILAAQHLFPRGSPNLDEVAYDAQARALLHGHLTLSRATHDPFFRPFVSGFRDDRVVFKYQPAGPRCRRVARHRAAPRCRCEPCSRPPASSRRTRSATAAAAQADRRDRGGHRRVLAVHLAAIRHIARVPALVRARHRRRGRRRSRPRAPHGRRAAFAAGLLLGFAAFHRPFDALLAALPVLVYAAIELRGSGYLARLTGCRGARRAAGRGPARGVQHRGDGRAVAPAVRRQRADRRVRLRLARTTFVVAGTGHEGQVHYTPGARSMRPGSRS